MSIRNIIVVMLCLSLVTGMTGCGGADYGQYAQAVKEQNITRQIRIEAANREREGEQRKHEEKMATLTGSLVMAASQTESPNDDMMVPLVMMMMEDKWAMAKMAAQANAPSENMAPIVAPESTGDLIKSATPLVLGVAGLGLAWSAAQNLKDVAVAGINSAGTHTEITGSGNEVTNDSYKSGTDNVVSGDGSSINAGSVDGCTDCGEDSIVSRYTDSSGDCRVSATCSCDSYDAGLCTP